MLSFSTVEVLDLKIMLPKEDTSTSSEQSSDPEDKENSDDDDDRNHKHRRRDARADFFDNSSHGQPIRRHNRKRHENNVSGQLYIETGAQSHEVQKEAPSRFEKRHIGNPSSLRSSFDLISRPRSSSFLQTDLPNYAGRGTSFGRGRGRSLAVWNQPESGFCSLDSLDFASHMTSQRPIHTSLFAGSSHNAPWGAFGFIHGLSNGIMDPLHPIGLQPALRPAINPMNLGITRHRCRDFEERGFCLRGDMCPMEHGINRIVVEDVQSLSQFNLPVSMPNSLSIGAQTGMGHSHFGSSSSAHMPNKNLLFKNTKAALNENAVRMNTPSSTVGVEADVYDPDQPLWNNNNSNNNNKDSPTVLLRQPSPSTEEETLWVADNSRKSSSDGNAARHMVKEARIGNEATVSSVLPSEQGKLNISEKFDMKTTAASTQPINISVDLERKNAKLQQKAQRTLYVCGIPLKNNKREALYSHFQKFGQVIDIYIPINGEKAFVQYNKREDAEAALKSPDAVMGNRFIKLFWANRDNINNAGQGISEGKMLTVGVANSVRLLPPAVEIGKKSLSSVAKKECGAKPMEILAPSIGVQKVAVLNSPKMLTSPNKKLENLGLLEELRRKQELLAQKRDEFRRQLIKFERQASIKKKNGSLEQVPKKQKIDLASSSAEGKSLPKNTSAESLVSPSSKAPAQISKPATRKAAPNPNLYKLDNRPASFRILPPLPAKLGNVTVLKDHFSKFGDLISIVFEESEDITNSSSKQLEKSFVCVTFGTLHSAEKAYQAGKYCEGCFLRFVWVTSSPVSEKKFEDNGDKTCLPSSSSWGELICMPMGASSSLDAGDPILVNPLEVGAKEFEDNRRDIYDENGTLTSVSNFIENMESGSTTRILEKGNDDSTELIVE